MKKDKLPIPVTTLVLMIVTITYKAVLVVIGIVIWIFGRGFLEGYLGQYMWVFYLGVGLNIFCVTFMMILVFAPGLAKWIMVKGLKLIEHLGFHGYSIITLTILQSVISVSVDMLPLPGGMGISESLYLVMFAPVFGEALLPAMLLSRGISYYAQMLISAVMTCVAYFIIGRKEQEEK